MNPNESNVTPTGSANSPLVVKNADSPSSVLSPDEANAVIISTLNRILFAVCQLANIQVEDTKIGDETSSNPIN